MRTVHPMYARGDSPPISLFRRCAGSIVFSGHGAVDAEGRYLAADFEGQMRHTLELLAITLQQAGVGFEDVYSVRSYVRDPENLPIYNSIYREYFCEPFPARTTITNCLPPGLEFEIECIAEERNRA